MFYCVWLRPCAFFILEVAMRFKDRYTQRNCVDNEYIYYSKRDLQDIFRREVLNKYNRLNLPVIVIRGAGKNIVGIKIFNIFSFVFLCFLQKI